MLGGYSAPQKIYHFFPVGKLVWDEKIELTSNKFQIWGFLKQDLIEFRPGDTNYQRNWLLGGYSAPKNFYHFFPVDKLVWDEKLKLQAINFKFRASESKN